MNKEEIVVFNDKTYRITGFTFDEWKKQLVQSAVKDALESTRLKEKIISAGKLYVASSSKGEVLTNVYAETHEGKGYNEAVQAQQKLITKAIQDYEKTSLS